MNTPNDDYLTPAEAAEWVRCSISLLAHYRRHGIGPKYYQPRGPGTRVFYRRSDLDLWITSGASDLRIQNIPEIEADI